MLQSIVAGHDIFHCFYLVSWLKFICLYNIINICTINDSRTYVCIKGFRRTSVDFCKSVSLKMIFLV